MSPGLLAPAYYETATYPAYCLDTGPTPKIQKKKEAGWRTENNFKSNTTSTALKYVEERVRG